MAPAEDSLETSTRNTRPPDVMASPSRCWITNGRGELGACLTINGELDGHAASDSEIRLRKAGKM